MFYATAVPTVPGGKTAGVPEIPQAASALQSGKLLPQGGNGMQPRAAIPVYQPVCMARVLQRRRQHLFSRV